MARNRAVLVAFRGSVESRADGSSHFSFYPGHVEGLLPVPQPRVVLPHRHIAAQRGGDLFRQIFHALVNVGVLKIRAAHGVVAGVRDIGLGGEPENR